MTALLALLAMLQAEPARDKSGLFEFARPAGWTAQDTPDGGRAFIAPDGSGAIVRFLQPEPWTGTPEAYHDALHSGIRQGAPIRSGGKPAPFGGFLRSECVVGAEGGPGLRLALYTAKVGDRFQGLFFAAGGDDAFEKHKAAADGLVKGIALPGGRDVKLLGLWLNGETKLQYGLDWGGGFSARMRSTLHILALWENGIAYRGGYNAPIFAANGLMGVPEGLAAVDAAALAAQSKLEDTRFSRWTEKGGVVDLPENWHGALKLTRAGEGFTAQDGATWVRIAPVDGVVLDGSYVAAATASAPEMRLVFRKDGAFEAVNVIHTLGGPTNNPAFPLQGKGRYEFRKWSLVLRFEGGYTKAVSFLASGEGLADAKGFVFGGTEFVKR